MFAAILAILAGAAALLGWALDIDILKRLLPTWRPMKPNTALCFVLIGIAIVCTANKSASADTIGIALSARAALLFALPAGVIGALTLADYLTGWNLGLDLWLLPEASVEFDALHPGRMAPESALCFLLLSIALAAGSLTKRNSAVTVAAIGGSLTVTALALAAVLSSLLPQLGSFGWFALPLMEIRTAFVFALLGSAAAALAWRSNPDGWSLGTGVTLMFVIGLLALLFAWLALSRNHSALAQAAAAIAQSERIQDQTELIKARIAQANGDLRAYILGGDRRFLQSYRESNEAIDRKASELRRYVAAAETKTETSYLYRMEALLAQRSDWQRQIVEAGHAGTPIALRNEAAGQVADELDTLMGEIKILQDSHRQHIAALLSVANDPRGSSSETVLGATLLSVLAFLIAMLRLNSSEAQNRQSTKALARSENHYRSIIQSAHDAIVTADSDGNIVGWNRGATQVFGYADGEMIGRPVTTLMSERFRERHLQGMRNAMTRENAFIRTHDSLLKGLRKDGAEFPIELSLARWEDGDSRFITATLRDVSVREATAQQIRMLSQAVEQSPESIVITDLDARIEFVNDAFLRATGYTRDEVIGRNPRILHSGKTPSETYVSLWRSMALGESWQGEFYNRRKDGSEYIEFAVVSPIRQADGQITHYLAVKEDITGRKIAAQALQDSKALLQNVINAIPDWIYVKDAAYRFILVNQSFALAFGKSPEDMIGRQDTEFVPLAVAHQYEGSGMRNFRDDDEAVFRGESIHTPCDKMFFSNGNSLIFDTYKVPLRDATQGIFGVLCVRRDVTERIDREQEQRALEAQLWQAQKMEVIGHLTGGVAHNFNNILASMLGYAELMQMSPELGTNETLVNYLNEILQSGIRAKELVGQLLSVSGKRMAATETIRVAPIVGEVMRLLRATLPASILIRTDIHDALPDVQISPVQLHQILMNLTVNARDAISGAGSIDVTIEPSLADPTRICDSCHHQFSGHYVLIVVRDSGSGISPEDLSRIFDPFFTTKKTGQGSGLGLSVLHGIVHAANGHVEVRTRPGAGSEFRIYLPAQLPRHADPVPQIAPAHRRSHAQGHIMVVDDEAMIVEYMTVLFKELGCTVTGVTSASAALRRFEDDPYDIDMVFTDQAMPEMTGADLCRAMLARRPDLPIVMNTGYSKEVGPELARQIGIRRLLLKPVPARVLEDLVAEFLPPNRQIPPRPETLME